MYTGISCSFYLGLMTPILILTMENTEGFAGLSEKQKISQSLYAMVGFGIGEFLGGFMSGTIIDQIGSKYAALVNFFLILIAGILQSFVISQLHFGVLAYVACFFWGLQDASVNTHTFQILGFEFKNASESFSILFLMQGVATFVC
jgi:predicted MFS family arabinose efflux permease